MSAPPGDLSFTPNSAVQVEPPESSNARLTVAYNPIPGIFNVLKVPEFPLGHSLMSVNEICKLQISQGTSPLSPGVFYVAAKYSYLDTGRLDLERHAACYILKTPVDKNMIREAVGKFMSFTVSQYDELFKTFFSSFCKVFNIRLSAEQADVSAMGTSSDYSVLEFLFYKDEHTLYFNVNGKRVAREYAIYSVMIRDVHSPIVPDDLIGIARTFPERGSSEFDSSDRCELYHMYIRENEETSAIVWLGDYKFKCTSYTMRYDNDTDRMVYVDPNTHLTILRK
jgi:hypothetical protein